jgi:hypothetical protein
LVEGGLRLGLAGESLRTEVLQISHWDQRLYRRAGVWAAYFFKT